MAVVVGAVMSGMEDTADIDKGRMFKMSVAVVDLNLVVGMTEKREKRITTM